MARLVIFALYYLVVTPLCVLGINWQFYAFQTDPNWFAIAATIFAVLVLPFGLIAAAYRYRK